MIRRFEIECENFTQYQFELIHRYIRYTLDKNNKTKLIIRSKLTDKNHDCCTCKKKAKEMDNELSLAEELADV